MHSPDAPTLPLDNTDPGYPEHGFPSPDDQATAELPLDDQALFDREFVDITENNADLAETGRRVSEGFKKAVGNVAIANADGSAPKPGTKWENRLRPENPYYGWVGFKRLSPGHPHQHHINAVKPKTESAVEGRQKGFMYGDHEVSVSNAVGAIRSLNIKQHVNEFQPESRTSHEGTVDHTGHRRSGYGTVQYRRPWSRIASGARWIRTPEEQIGDERNLSLREIGTMHHLDEAMADVAEKDESGRFNEALRSGNPQAIRHELGELSSQLVISEHNPLHARWSEAMDPQNVQKFRHWLIENSSEQATGETPAAQVLHIAAAGIMGSVRPRAVADYLGVSFEEWDEQRHGFIDDNENHSIVEKNENHAVPKEVVDQICFLIKLDGREVGGTVMGDDGKERPRSALDVLIASGAAQPWTEVMKGPEHEDPMQRVANPEIVEARAVLEQDDREQAKVQLMTARFGANLDDLNHRLAELDPDKDDDREEFESLTKQKTGLIRRLRKSGVPVPEETNRAA